MKLNYLIKSAGLKFVAEIFQISALTGAPLTEVAESFKEYLQNCIDNEFYEEDINNE